jgi:hypothetical protein
MFDKQYTRVPKTVYALQWLPHARLPNVVNIMGEVVQPNFNTAMGMTYNSADPFQPPKQPKITCIGATVKIGEQDTNLEPFDWIIYSCENSQPIQVLSERMFAIMYVDSTVFKLCETCAEVAKSINRPLSQGEPQTLQDYLAILKMGKSIIVPTASGSMEFKTEQEFRDFCAKFGKTI